MFFNEIIPNLYQGKFNLEYNQFDFIIICSENDNDINIPHIKLSLKDIKNEKLINHFDHINNIIDNKISTSKLCIMCDNGISLSTTFIISYLIYKGMKLNEALNLVKIKSNNNCRPNIKFFSQLITYENKFIK